MSTVQPIRDVKKIEVMKKILLSQNIRDFTMFTLGINSGLRISDLLNLKFGDVLKDGKLVHEIRILEQKTRNKTNRKYKDFPMGKKTQKALKEYIDQIGEFDLEDPLFFSRKKKVGKRQPITRQHAHDVISSAAKDVGILDAIGTHTLRKTFGYHAYKNGTDLSLLQDMMNHESSQTTLRYIGITKEEKDKVYISLDL
ncbi:site-specific integrase [Bacillus sp. AFS073361]|uniref:tyrosine-type recombinase/integrase n=1 Tax=Bacillus sp. AFS073361 TaxID=2033511 RepID=UPI000BF4F6A2|nr:tyrosine-type recombinase/integrase [Bacillus sp. AFS073361]PFP29432.1 site-specific integrase [Bacillus sp. AFS073361]